VATTQLRTLDSNSLWATLGASGVSEPFHLASHGPTVLASLVTAVGGTSPSLQVFLDVQDLAGNWQQVAVLTAQTAAGVQSAQFFNGGFPGPQGKVGRFRWTLGGTAPSVAVLITAAAR
jgi:hypothetical protein